MRKRLTKRARSLWFSLLALVIVGALLAALLLLLPPADTQEDNPPAPSETVALFNKAAEDKVTLTSAVISLAKTQHTLSVTADKLYTLLGYEDLPFDQTLLSNTADTLLSINATRLVTESPQDPTEFGFDTKNNGVSVLATYSDNSTFAFEIGNLTPAKDSYYLRVSGKPAIYTMDSAFCETVSTDLIGYLNLSPIVSPQSTETTDTVVVRDVTLDGTVRPSPIFFQIAKKPENDTSSLIISSHMIQRPYFHAADAESPLLTYTTYSMISASGVEKIRPTKADLKSYGLSNPYSTCTVNLSLERTTTTKDAEGKETKTVSYHSTLSYTIELSKPNKDGNYYGVVYTEKTMLPILYQFSADSVKSWVTAQYDDVADKLLYFNYIQDMDAVTITANGKTHVFELTHIPDETDTDKNLIVKADGKTYPVSGFRTLYSSILCLLRTGTAKEKPSGAPLLSVTFKPHNGDITKIDIYAHTAGHGIAVHSTGERHLVDMKAVQSLIKTYEKYLAGEDIRS